MSRSSPIMLSMKFPCRRCCLYLQQGSPVPPGPGSGWCSPDWRRPRPAGAWWSSPASSCYHGLLVVVVLRCFCVADVSCVRPTLAGDTQIQRWPPLYNSHWRLRPQGSGGANQHYGFYTSTLFLILSCSLLNIIQIMDLSNYHLRDIL